MTSNKEIEDEIWLTAYLTALRSQDPEEAARSAALAIDFYTARASSSPSTVRSERTDDWGTRGYMFSELGDPNFIP